MKRSHFHQMMYPAGSIIRFLGRDWNDEIQNALGLIIEHCIVCAYGEESMRILVNGKALDISYGDIRDDELELVQ